MWEEGVEEKSFTPSFLKLINMEETEREEFMRQTSESINEAEAEAEADETQNTYEPLTVEALTEIVNDLRSNNPTPNDVVTHYETTGNLIINADSTTGVTYTTSNNSTTGTTYIPVPPTTDQVTVNVEGTQVPPAEPIPIPEERRKKIREDRLRMKLHLQNESLEYKRSVFAKEMVITKNDLIILADPNAGEHCYNFFHFDVEGEHKVKDCFLRYHSYTRRRRSGDESVFVENAFVFDKNMKRLAVNRDGIRNKISGQEKIRTRRDMTRIWNYQISYAYKERGRDVDSDSFIIIDKEEFINSRGRKWKLKRRENLSYSNIKLVRQKFIERFIEVEQFVKRLNEIVSKALPPDEFDIFYVFGRPSNDIFSRLTSTYCLLMKFSNVTITNSIEMKHEIEELMVTTQGNHYQGMVHKMIGGLSGMRMAFTPEDARANYRHSHLTSGLSNFTSFCTGGVSYSSMDREELNEFEVHEIIFRIYNFIQWESLEGGPHYKMENIKNFGSRVTIEKNIIGKDRYVPEEYLTELIGHINATPLKFAYFSECFSLTNQGGVLRFVVDYDKFYDKFIELFDNNTIRDIGRRYSLPLYTRKMELKEFYSVGSETELIPSLILADAQEKLKNLVPVYLNGKYVRPRLTNFNPTSAIEGMRFCPEPNIMREIAQYILFKLTDKLEEHGNTSESREESRVSAI
jgi:hypothetical protein